MGKPNAGLWTLATAIVGLILLAVGALIGVPSNSKVIDEPEPGGDYVFPIDKCQVYADQKAAGAGDEDEAKRACAQDCVRTLNYSSGLATEYWTKNARNRTLWSGGALLFGSILAAGAIFLARWRPPVWKTKYLILLAFTVAQAVALVGVAVHEKWIQSGPAPLRQATMPVVRMAGNPLLWGTGEGRGMCRAVLSTIDPQSQAGLSLLQYEGLGAKFAYHNPDDGDLRDNATQEEIDLRKTDAIDTVSTVPVSEASNNDSAAYRPPPTEPGVYALVSGFTGGAAARSPNAFLPLMGPFASLGFWKLGLFMQMLVISLLSTVIAVGGVLVIDKISASIRYKKG